MPASRSGSGYTRRTAHRILAAVKRLRADTSGAVIILAAILFPVVIGGFGLGAETGYNYLTQRKLQHAADVSAHAGGTRLRAGDKEAEIDVAAKAVAAGSGAIEPTSSVVVNLPPQESRKGFNGDENSVEVIITRMQPRLFSAVIAGIYSNDTKTHFAIDARAIAQVQTQNRPPACVHALSATAAPAVNISGSADIMLKGCDIHSNSNAPTSLEVSGSAKLNADCVSAVGGIVVSTNTTLADPDCPREEVGSLRDPFADVEQPPVSGSCQSRNVGTPNSTKTTVAKPGNYCNGLALKGPVHFEPGVYIVQGDMTVNAGENTSLTGDGVTFFLTNNAKLTLNGHAKLNLSAPTDGPLKGLLFFGDREDNVSHVVNGSSGSTLQGAIYAAGSDIIYRGNSASTNGCTQLVGDTVTFTGNSTMESSCDSAGYEDIPSYQTVKLVE